MCDGCVASLAEIMAEAQAAEEAAAKAKAMAAFLAAWAAKRLLLSDTDLATMQREGITAADGVVGLTEGDLTFVGIDVAACRRNFQARAAAEAVEARAVREARAVEAKARADAEAAAAKARADAEAAATKAHAEAEVALADAEALRAVVGRWGLPAALAAAITQCQPPLTVGKLLGLGTDRRAFEAALGGGCTLILAEWKMVEAKAAEVRCTIHL